MKNCVAIALFAATFMPLSVSAQIAPATDGTNSMVIQSGANFNITGGTQAGTNLFHSFQRFGLNTGQAATFISNPSIQNILGRVTGGDASVINGLIRVTGGNANLYLMNPAGIVFGANATLNVPGSFTATTANGIGIGNGWFNATGNNNYATLVGDPNQFAFTTIQPGAIINAGHLAVGAGQRITLLGGTVINTGTLTALGGTIDVVAVPGEKLVRVSQAGSLLSLELPTETRAALNLTTVAPVALPALLTGGNLASATGLAVEKGVVKLTGSGIAVPASAGVAIATNTLNVSGTKGGIVNVLGEKVGVVGALINAAGTNGGGTVLLGGDYKGQGTVPNAQQTYVSRDSVINANAVQNGDGGKVVIWADDTTRFYGTISARGGAQSGNGGFVEVSGKGSLVYKGNVNVLAPQGMSGRLLLDPTNIVIRNGSADGNDNSGAINAFGNNGAGDNGLVFASDALPTVLYESEIEGMVGIANIVIEATNDIVIEDLADNELTIPATGTDSAVPPRSITFKADADRDGNGRFDMNTGDTINAGGALGSGSDGRNLVISGAGVTVGDIQSGSISIRSTKNIQAGDLRTELNFAGSLDFGVDGSISLVSTGGSIVVETLKANGGGSSQLISIDAFDLFQARGTFTANTLTNTFVDLAASIATPGAISIKHGGKTFIAGYGLERDANNEVIYRADSGPRAGERLFPQGTSAFSFNFSDGTENPPDSGVSAIATPIAFDPASVPVGTSYTRGTLLIGGGTDATYYTIFQNSVLTPSIQVQAVSRTRPSENSSSPNTATSANVAVGGTLNSGLRNLGEGGQVIQRQNNSLDQNSVCSVATIAAATPETRSSNSSQPCASASDDTQILKILGNDAESSPNGVMK